MRLLSFAVNVNPNLSKKQLTESHFYNPALPNIQDILRKKQAILHCYTLPNVWETFSKRYLSSLSAGSPNLRDLLVHAKLTWTPTTDIQAPCWHFPLQFQSRLAHLPRVGVLPYMGYLGKCRCEGYGFQAVNSGCASLWQEKKPLNQPFAVVQACIQFCFMLHFKWRLTTA